MQDLPPRNHDAMEPKGEQHSARTLEGSSGGSVDLDAMSADQLRAMLAAKREAKRVSQAKWRAKAK